MRIKREAGYRTVGRAWSKLGFYKNEVGEGLHMAKQAWKTTHQSSNYDYLWELALWLCRFSFLPSKAVSLCFYDMGWRDLSHLWMRMSHLRTFWQSSGQDSTFPMQGVWVQSLVRELRFPMPCNMAKKI